MLGLHIYRCFLIDAHSCIASAQQIACHDDDAAMLRAREILADRPACRGVEVWERDRRVLVKRDVEGGKEERRTKAIFKGRQGGSGECIDALEPIAGKETQKTSRRVPHKLAAWPSASAAPSAWRPGLRPPAALAPSFSTSWPPRPGDAVPISDRWHASH